MKNFMYIILLSVMMTTIQSSTTHAKESVLDITKIYEVLENHPDVTIEQWSVLARTAIYSVETEIQFIEELNKLKRLFPQFEWVLTKDSTKMSAIGTTESEHFQERLSIVSQLDSQTATYITYEWLGSVIDEDILENLTLKLNDTKKSLFKENTTYFTCVKGLFNDTIDGVLTSQVDGLLELFQAQEIEKMLEENFISLTANSSLFEKSFISENYNLQLAMRIDGLSQKSSFVIGTPIITFEY